MAEEIIPSVNVRLDQDTQSRKGVFADFVMARTKGGTTRLDFSQLDSEAEDGARKGVMVSRIFMNNEDLISLRDMLNKHTAQWKVGGDGSDE